MAELSALGIKVTSDGVVKTTGELDRFAKASNAARAAAKPINVKVGVAGLAKATSDLQKMQKAMSALDGKDLSGAVKMAQALSRIEIANNKAAISAQNLAAATARASTAQSNASTAALRLETARTRTANAASMAAKAEDQLAAAARRSSAASATSASSTPRAGGGGFGNQGNPANIAAQFQDIGVTAAMGMNPLMIALQQGTQLSAALAGGIGNLGKAIAQVLSPTSLLTIGLVALAAAGLQNIDWMEVAQSSLNMLASGMDYLAASANTLAPIIITVGTAMLIAFGPQLIAAVSATAVAIGTTLVSAIVSATTAMAAFALANPFTAIVLGVTAAGAAIAYFAGATIDDLKGAIDFIIGGFVGAFNTIKRTWSMLPAAIGDAAVQAVNWALRAITDLINKSISGINSLIGMIPEFMRPGKIGKFGGLSQMNNPWAGALANTGNIAAEEMGKAQGVKYTDGFIASVKGALSSGADAIRGFAAGLGASPGESLGGGGAGKSSGASSVVQDDPWADIIDGADKQMRALQQAGAQIGVYGQALSRLRYEQELFNQAQDAGIKLTADQDRELRTRAATMAEKEYQNTVNQARADSIKSHDEAIRQLDAERVALGLSGEELIAYEYQQSLINKQLSAGVELKDIDITKTAEQAKEYAKQRYEIDKTIESIRNLVYTLNTLEGMRGAIGSIAGILSGIKTGNFSGIGGDIGKIFRIAGPIVGENGWKAVTDKLDKIFGGASGDGTFIKSMTNLLANAAIGSTSANLAGGSKFGGALGGALGGKLGEKFLEKPLKKALGDTLGSFAGPLGSIVGGAIGGIIGGAFKKVKWGAVDISASGTGASRGNNSAAEKAAVSVGDSIMASLNQIADAFGGVLGNFGNITVGQRHGDWRVNPNGTSLKIKKGAVEFDDDSEGAIAYAIQIAIERGAITGIRASTQTLLKSSGDLQTKMNKALSFEGVFDELEQRLNPTGYALDQLSKEFKGLLKIFQEAGATTEEYAKLEKLFELKRKDAMEEASNTLKDFVKSLNIGSSSPLSLRDQSASAKIALDPYLSAINSGQSIDQSKYVEAAKAYLDIQRQMYGSTSKYFEAFNMIQDATNKAIASVDNATPIRTKSDPYIQETASTTKAMQADTSNTVILLGKIRDLLEQRNRTDGSGFIGTTRNYA